jgi:hypothetical protein
MNMRALVAAAAAALTLAVPATAEIQPPPANTPPDAFARLDQDCLGPLRSAIARGELPGLAPGFNGQFNPSGHYGTVAEARFLASVLGLPLSSPPTQAELEALEQACAAIVAGT